MAKEGIIQKIENKTKEIVEDIEEGIKETAKEITHPGVLLEKSKEVFEKVEEGVKETVEKIMPSDKNEGVDKEAEERAEMHKKEEMKKSHSKNHPIKDKKVKKLIEEMGNSKTIMIVNIGGLPSKQFQEIKKSIRTHAKVQVIKKNIIRRAIEKFGKKDIVPLEEHIKESSAIAISNMEGYELAGILAKKKTPAAAKAGQESPEDIEVKSGPTDLVPGPAISELGAVGLKIAVEDGKLSIKNTKVIVKAGDIISPNVASILQKLNITPFNVGLEPVAIYDVETGIIYTDINIDSEEAKNSLLSAAGNALGFAQKIVYYSKETIGYLLAKANVENEALVKLSSVETKVSAESKEEGKEEKSEEAVTPVEVPTETSGEKAPEDDKKTDTQLNNPEENA